MTLAEFRKWEFDYREFFRVRGGARSARVIYDPEDAVAKIIQARRSMKTPHHILEDALEEACHNIIEYLGKLRNGWKSGDEYLTRYAARVVAQYAEKAVVALNDLSPISENVVWHQVLKAARRPQHFRFDYPLALGLRATQQTSRVYLSAYRLARETLSLVKTEFGRKATARAFQALLEEAPAQIA